jgi:outer membrane protein OmpA-like peptidoglycan-associated protein
MSQYGDDYDDDYDDDEFDNERPLKRIILGGAAVVVLSALLWFVIRPSLGGGGTTSASSFESAADTVVVDQAATSTITPVAPSSSTQPVDQATTLPDATTSTAAAEATTTIADLPAAPTDSSPLPGQPEQENGVGGASYPTLPDGSPTPVLAIFDTDTITLSGTVPSQAAADRLAQLALANSKTPAALVEFIAINPDVPANVGVRVIEMNSSRFPAGSAEVLPDHGHELDRIGAVMNALPNTTVLVIGHADQRGSSGANFVISEDRARAVVSHLVEYGIEGSRLSSRAVGESDLLSLNDDETALELNRRTEFVIYGTMLGA